MGLWRGTDGDLERLVACVASACADAMRWRAERDIYPADMGTLGTEERLLRDLEKLIAERRAKLAPPPITAEQRTIIESHGMICTSAPATNVVDFASARAKRAQGVAGEKGQG